MKKLWGLYVMVTMDDGTITLKSDSTGYESNEAAELELERLLDSPYYNSFSGKILTILPYYTR